MKFASMFMPLGLSASLVLLCAPPARARKRMLGVGFRAGSAPRYGLEVPVKTRKNGLIGEITGIFHE